MNRRLALLCVGLIVLVGCGAPSPGPAPAASQAMPVEAPYGVIMPSEDMTPAAVAVPSLGVESTLIPVGVTESNTVDASFAAEQAAWYRHSVDVGEVGPLVLLGHVDGGGQPGIFNRLAEIEPGASVFVSGASGRVVEYLITRVEQHPKDAFPTGLVYAPTSERALRLITCGGPFGTERAGHYDDNVIAFGVIRTE